MSDYKLPEQSAKNRFADMPDELKPREKALAYGIKALDNVELMAIIFGTGMHGKDVMAMCREILDDNRGHISLFARMDVREVIERYKGIGPAKALTVLAALELGARSASDALLVENPSITQAKLAYEFMRSKLGDLDHEEFWVLFLRRNLTPLRAMRVGQGGLDATYVDIKVIMREAIKAGSSAVMLFHNHPSGNTNPSSADIELTRRIVAAAKTLEISVPDHIIMTYSAYYSFNDNGIMPKA